MYLTSSHR